MFQQQAVLTASDGAAGDDLGFSMAMSGNTIAVSAANATVGGHALQGAVYVFTKPAGGWTTMTQAAKLTASDGAAHDFLGSWIAMSGDTIAAGSSATINGHARQGAVYVFTEPAGGWASQPNQTQAAKLTASNGVAGDNLGDAVAMDGGTVIASATGATVNGHAHQGAVYVFTEPAGGWASQPNETQAAKLTVSDGVTQDRLGNALAMDGGTVVAGALATINGHVFQGAAYVFTEPATGWASQPVQTQAAKLTSSDGAAGDLLGGNVAVNGAIVAAAALGATVNGHASQGAVYIYTEPAAGWASQPNETETAKLTASDGAANDGLGSYLAFAGPTLAAGAQGAAVNGNASQGAVYLFAPPTGGWASQSQTAKLTAPDGAAGDQFGFVLAAQGNTIAVAAPFATVGPHPSQGKVYVFTPPGLRELSMGSISLPGIGSRVAPGTALTLTVQVRFPGGPVIADTLAQMLAGNCDVTIRASGAQTLGTHCMRYDSARHRFSYRWRLGVHGTGPATVEASLAWPNASVTRQQITIGRS